MNAVYGLYPTPEAAQRAVNSLRAAGVADEEITIISSEPFEEHEFAHRDKATAMGWIALGGAILGLLTATWLTRMTELAWPLSTGNMPIVAWWPNLIVMFELTMLGGILAAVTTLLVTAKLVRRRPAFYDPAVSDGQILVGVEVPADDAAVERALAGGELRRI
ncbi:MAG TPA: quinol:electron acceptor oxidoreductase subunit ActD [Vicinamibacterales bacterium]|nr:quinol:electron acceptor oxidoreductase subunit ActD [Vicinamibacterales bacterium]